eukprot:TRINITY_DN8350_c1_g1_i3.p1 TRINITY_DN8350_c1_g1~~TRINITY_DN8350_c1_g1_i3.p1  ORF type:complete len:617 (-),score=88.56 TRINITY_DN8350_c1_g1_i3:179-2029(-)
MAIAMQFRPTVLERRPLHDSPRGNSRTTLHEAVVASCEHLGRPAAEAARVMRYLESEWLCDVVSLHGLSEDGWREIRLPLGLKHDLRRRIDLIGVPGMRYDMPSPSVWTPPGWSAPPQVSPGANSKSKADEVIGKVQAEFRRRGRGSVAGLGKRFRIMDDDRSGHVDYNEFIKAMIELNLPVSENELHLIWHELDKDGSGSASFDELVSLIGGKLTGRRQRAVKALFNLLDVNKNGVIQVDDLKLRLDPAAIAGKISKFKASNMDEVMHDFLENFRKLIGGAVVGEINYQEFEHYYEGISASVDNDTYFEEILRRAWCLPETWLATGGRQVSIAGNAGGGPDIRMARGGNPGLVPSYHQHHKPSSVGGALKGFVPNQAKQEAAHSGEALIRKLSFALAQSCRGKAENLYGDAVVQCYRPGSRWRQAAHAGKQATSSMAGGVQGTSTGPTNVLERADLVSKVDFEALVYLILPTMPSQDVANLCAIFQDHERKDCVYYREFLQLVGSNVTPQRQACARRVFEELSSGSAELDLASLKFVPPGALFAFGERARVSLGVWLGFHEVVAAAAGDIADEDYESQLRYVWGLQSAAGVGAQRNRKGAGPPGYYRGLSRIHLG